MAKGERVFNNRPRKVFRKHIPSGEALFGAVFLAFVGGMTIWFAAHKNAYDPDLRDVSMETMEAAAVEDKLWRMPLQPWHEPGTEPAGGVAVADTGIFPAALLEGGWSLAGRVQAFTPENVYEKINGAADQYIQYGMTQAFFTTLEKAGEDLSIGMEVYYHETFSNALGIFGAQRDAKKQVRAEGGAYFYDTPVGAIGIAGPYYFKITGAQEGEPTLAKARQLVEMLGNFAQGKGGASAGFDIFAGRLGLPFASIQFQKSDVFQFDFAKDFWFAQPQANGPRLFFHEGAAPEEAKTLFDQLVQNNLYDYEQVEHSDGQAVLKHKFLGEFLVLRTMDGNVYGIDGAADLEAAKGQLEQLESAIAGNVTSMAAGLDGPASLNESTSTPVSSEDGVTESESADIYEAY